MKHLVLFDGECGLCNRAVRWMLAQDKSEMFAFAPLQGETAKQYLQPPIPLDTLVLVEDYRTSTRVWRYGKGALRILWLLGGWWRIPGICCFLPRWLADPIYRLIARHRKVFSGGAGDFTGDRFLP